MNIISIIKKYLKIRFTGDVFYVNGSDTLPPPLTREEEADVFSRLSAHDTASSSPSNREDRTVHDKDRRRSHPGR